jgi:hypothetical protein
VPDYFDAVVDHRFTGAIDLWAVYERAGPVLLSAASALGSFVEEAVYVKASDDSVTISRQTISEARSVLDGLNLGYDYSFYTISGRPDHQTRFGVYLWEDQSRIMVTVSTTSHVASEGLKSVIAKYFRRADDSAPRAAEGVSLTGDADSLPTRRRRSPGWASKRNIILAVKWIAGIGSGLLLAWLVWLLGWN